MISWFGFFWFVSFLFDFVVTSLCLALFPGHPCVLAFCFPPVLLTSLIFHICFTSALLALSCSQCFTTCTSSPCEFSLYSSLCCPSMGHLLSTSCQACFHPPASCAPVPVPHMFHVYWFVFWFVLSVCVTFVTFLLNCQFYLQPIKACFLFHWLPASVSCIWVLSV